MKILLVGATGVLGRAVLAELRGSDHEPVTLARTPESEERFTSRGIRAVRGDIYDTESLRRAAEGCDAVFHLATRIPRKSLPRPADYDETNRLRTEGTRNLVEAARAAGVATVVYQSVAFIFPDRKGEAVTEESAPVVHPLVDAVLTGERLAVDSGLRGVALRGGFFLERGSWHSDWMHDAIRRRKLPLIGRGDGFYHPVHVRDVARAFVEAAQNDKARGVYHVAAESVEMRELVPAWAARMGARPPRRMPAWLAKLVMGPAAQMVMARYRVSSEKIRRELGFEFLFPTYREILDDLCAA